MKWSLQQEKALYSVAAWHEEGEAPIFRVFGYAGTGKTTLAKHFAEQIDGDTCYCAFTGKASIVMRKNGCQGASTIHSLIYEPKQDEATGETTFKINRDSDAKHAALIVVDECSMVGEDLAKDLMSFGTPILVLGDPAQLPPVKGSGFFTDAEPDVMLTEIHRQAKDSPIIRLATDVREGRGLTFGSYGDSKVITRERVEPEEVTSADQILVGKNKTRESYNRRMREINGFDGLPNAGERLVCIKNNQANHLFNGGLFNVTRSAKDSEEDNSILMSIQSEDFPEREAIEVLVRREFFDGGYESIPWQDLRGTDQFLFGYALTVHKSQGSQWDHVYLFDESGVFRDDAARHLYTGITRAAEKVTVVV